MAAAMLGGLELATRLGFDRVSQIQRRTIREYAAAVATGRDPAQPRPQSLLVGNSLLLHAVDLPVLQASMAGTGEMRRFVVESTNFFDWYFGLRRLFDEGARVDFILLTLSPAQIVDGTIRGDYFASYLMSTRDALSVARAANLDLSATASLLFARASKFWAVRKELRKWLLELIFPDFRNLMKIATARGQEWEPSTQGERYEREAAQRLSMLSRLLAEHGAKLVWVVPPTSSHEAEGDLSATRRAGVRAGLPVLVPAPPGVMTKAEFLDGYHLNPAGAQKFTRLLIPLLRSVIVERP